MFNFNGYVSIIMKFVCDRTETFMQIVRFMIKDGTFSTCWMWLYRTMRIRQWGCVIARWQYWSWMVTCSIIWIFKNNIVFKKWVIFHLVSVQPSSSVFMNDTASLWFGVRENKWIIRNIDSRQLTGLILCIFFIIDYFCSIKQGRSRRKSTWCKNCTACYHFLCPL